MIILYVLGGVWLAAPLFCWAYILLMWPFALRYVGRTYWYAFEFEMVSDDGWHARLWRDWYGVGLWGAMVMRKADHTTMLHEGQHCKDCFWMGGYFYLVYILHSIWIWLFQKNKHAYYDNWFERRARKAAGQRLDIPKHLWAQGQDDRWSFW